jgi:thiol-disulfide isomerase/thioredoxin
MVAALVAVDSSSDAQVPAWLGVAMAPATSGGTPVKGVPDKGVQNKGVIVERVFRGSPAAAAGVKVGDVLVAVGAESTDSPDVVGDVVRRTGVGRDVTLTVKRGAKRLTLRTRLTALPNAQERLRLEFVGQPAPSMGQLSPLRGELRATGSVTVVEFAATWCGPCAMLAPVLDRWQRTYGARGLQVVSVYSEPEALVSRHVMRDGFSSGVALDPEALFTRAYGVTNLPTVAIVGRDGVVRDIVIGVDESELRRMETEVERLLVDAALPTKAK